VAADAPISGPAEVIDGNTVVVQGTALRLFGIDAPDLDQTCGRRGRTLPCGNIARTALMDLVAGSVADCRPVAGPHGGTDGRGRVIARCSVGGFDVGSNMVHTGWALADPRSAPAPYRETETRARARQVGLWRTTFVPPWDWRQRQSEGPDHTSR